MTTRNSQPAVKKDLANDLASHAANARYADLPKQVVDATKKFILDTLGTALAGSNALGCQPVAHYFCEQGGSKQSTVWAFGGHRIPAANAALVNSMLAHAIEFDDTHDATT